MTTNSDDKARGRVDFSRDFMARRLAAIALFMAIAFGVLVQHVAPPTPWWLYLAACTAGVVLEAVKIVCRWRRWERWLDGATAKEVVEEMREVERERAARGGGG